MSEWDGTENRKSDRRAGNLGNNLTNVRFSLWSVLGFLVLITGICIGYLFNSQALIRDESRIARQNISERLIKIETNYAYLVEGINEIKNNQEVMMSLVVKNQKKVDTRWKDR